MAVTYRNTKTGRVTHLGEASPVMDRSTRWMRVVGDVEPVELGAGAQDEGPAPAPFQPADHTVDQVNEHLADAGAEERERIIQAETEGKARRGIIQGPYADLSGQE